MEHFLIRSSDIKYQWEDEQELFLKEQQNIDEMLFNDDESSDS